MRRECLAGVAIGLSMLLGARSQTPMSVVRAADRTAADEQAIGDAEVAWANDCKSGDLEKILRHYTDDAQVTFPDRAFPVQGKDNIRVELKELLAAGNLSVTFTPSGHDHPSPVRWGVYSLTWKDPKAKTWAAEDGPYLTVFRKLANGSRAVAEQNFYGRHLRYPTIPGGDYLRDTFPDPTAPHTIVG
jgi:ketosteroid isomerase-like protein